MYKDTIEMHGFTFEIELEPDERWLDLSWLGEYSDTPKTDAVDRKFKGDQGRNEYRYFNPENTLKEGRDYLHKQGYSKHEAHEIAKHQILSDYEYMERLNSGYDGLNCLVVTVSYKGHELGHASVGEIDSWESGTADYQTELMIECMDQAIKYLENLGANLLIRDNADKILSELKAKLAEEGHENRRASFLWRIKRWRDLSHEYQKNRRLTRHAARRVWEQKLVYYQISR